MQESMNHFQEGVKNEMHFIKKKMNDLENQTLELRLNCNSKINGEEVRDIIDKKLQILGDYRRDTDTLTKRCTDMSQQLKYNMVSNLS